MPFEIFLLPGLVCFAYGFYRALNYYKQENSDKEVGDNFNGHE